MRRTKLEWATFSVVAIVCVAIFEVFLCGAVETGAQEGAILFEQKGCAKCHYTQSTKTKRGPGLKGLFQRDSLPVSGNPVTEENVRKQLITPFKDMPSFARKLTEEQRDSLIQYLKTL